MPEDFFFFLRFPEEFFAGIPVGQEFLYFSISRWKNTLRLKSRHIIAFVIKID